jgi:cytochrome c biogenesis protein CcmG/thiol:disulfide interchange protein DsbE
MNGDSFRLADHRGEVVVVNFWATWCPPCRREIPGFIELQKEWGDKGLTFVGVSLDEEGFDAVRPYAEKMGINYPLVVDDGSVAQKYGGVSALPTSFIVGPEGTVQHARPGFLPESVLRDQVAPLLKRARANE